MGGRNVVPIWESYCDRVVGLGEVGEGGSAGEEMSVCATVGGCGEIAAIGCYEAAMVCIKRGGP